MNCETIYSWVADLPIVDWHNHLDLAALAADAPLGSLYSTWVAPDPYKHRAMRICGEPERLITGDASEAEKWAAWKRTLPKLVGNPLFDWARAELAVLGLDGSENVSLSGWTPSKILRKLRVEAISPCVGKSGLSPRVAQPGAGAPGAKPRIIPSLRLDFGDEVPLETLERFHAAGCRVVDISVDDAAALAGFAPGAPAPGRADLRETPGYAPGAPAPGRAD
ncbi:MAG: glucuronate isomerase, partial [Kiritimatiellae bacterium]|nr:glucuronate isomerase [Kiritimatiellia bacterium]